MNRFKLPLNDIDFGEIHKHGRTHTHIHVIVRLKYLIGFYCFLQVCPQDLLEDHCASTVMT